MRRYLGAVEETFQFAKNEIGLNHYQARRYDDRYRHGTLSMLAAAFLALSAPRERLRDQNEGYATRPTTDPVILQRDPSNPGEQDPAVHSGAPPVSGPIGG